MRPGVNLFTPNLMFRKFEADHLCQNIIYIQKILVSGYSSLCQAPGTDRKGHFTLARLGARLRNFWAEPEMSWAEPEPLVHTSGSARGSAQNLNGAPSWASVKCPKMLVRMKPLALTENVLYVKPLALTEIVLHRSARPQLQSLGLIASKTCSRDSPVLIPIPALLPISSIYHVQSNV